jgi:hypothetical protein
MKIIQVVIHNKQESDNLCSYILEKNTAYGFNAMYWNCVKQPPLYIGKNSNCHKGQYDGVVDVEVMNDIDAMYIMLRFNGVQL